ncbi:MAG: hypothetical protein Kow00109_28270 [Acidobacteriota bacterium]
MNWFPVSRPRRLPTLRLSLGIMACWLAGTTFTAAGPPLSYHDFAQVASGPNLRTVFLVYNASDEWCRVELAFRNDQGGPLSLPFAAVEATAYGFDLFPGTVVELPTAFSEDLRVGWATLQANCEVGAQVLFEIHSGGQLVTQAAVESPGPVQHADLFVVRRPGTETGIAVANLAASPIRVHLELTQGGSTIGRPVSFDLLARGHTAKFLGQLFEGQDLPQEVTGILHVTATGPVALTTLQQTGLVLGTLPVMERRNYRRREGD